MVLFEAANDVAVPSVFEIFLNAKEPVEIKAGEMVKLWIGFLTAVGIAYFVFAGGSDAVSYVFFKSWFEVLVG